MAVIRCSLRNGRLAVEEVLEFDRGDKIQLEKSAEVERAKFLPEAVTIIPCPPPADCGGGYAVCLKAFAPDATVTLPPGRED
jgi:hypothetical protein